MAVGGDRRAPGDGQMCPTRPNPGAIHQRKPQQHPPAIYFTGLLALLTYIRFMYNAQIINWATFFILVSTAGVSNEVSNEVGTRNRFDEIQNESETNTVNVRPCATCLYREFSGKI